MDDSAPENDPAGHSEQSGGVPELPAKQPNEQTDDPAAAENPGSHGVQREEPAELDVPMGHTLQRSAPAGLLDPAGHCVGWGVG